MPPYHPTYRYADPESLAPIDDSVLSWQPRAWAAFAHSALQLAEQTGRGSSTSKSRATRSRRTAALARPLSLRSRSSSTRTTTSPAWSSCGTATPPHGQALCEPDPTATTRGVALHLLAALGKHIYVPAQTVRGRRSAATSKPSTFTTSRSREHTHSATARFASSLKAPARLTAGFGRSASRSDPRPRSPATRARTHEQSTLDTLLDRWRAAETPPDADTVPRTRHRLSCNHTRSPTQQLTRAPLACGLLPPAARHTRNVWDEPTNGRPLAGKSSGV